MTYSSPNTLNNPLFNTQERQQLMITFACAFGFLIAALAIFMTNSNSDLFLLINNAGRILPNWFWSNATLIADTAMAAALLCILASVRPKALFAILFLLVAGGIVIHLGKQLLSIPRPPAVLDNELFHIIGPRLTRHSFPSGHSFTALACFGLLAFYCKSHFQQALLIGLGSLMALSRITVGAHWPLDVTVGAGLGLAFAGLAFYLNQRYSWHRWSKAQHGVMAILTLGSIYLSFHDSRYPDTRLLSVLVSISAVLISFYFYWRPLIKNKFQSPSSH